MHKPTHKSPYYDQQLFKITTKKTIFATQKPRIIENFSINCRPQTRHIHISTTNRQTTQYCSETQAKFCVTSGSKNLGERTLKITVKFLGGSLIFLKQQLFIKFSTVQSIKNRTKQWLFEILPPFRVSRETTRQNRLFHVKLIIFC